MATALNCKNFLCEIRISLAFGDDRMSENLFYRKETINEENYTIRNSIINSDTLTIKGIVKSKKGEVIAGANVLIDELKIGTATDESGRFWLAVPYKKDYIIKISSIGYKKYLEKIKVERIKGKVLIFYLEEEIYLLGGIEVKATKEKMPDKPYSSLEISGADIEHFQAMSLKDVLDLDPSIIKTDNPGLSRSAFAAIRGDFVDPVASSGVAIFVDGVRISNTYNLQYEKLSGAKYGYSDMGRGIDLRKIPGDNIESVEIVKGAVSAKYGEYASGIIKVSTKTHKQPHRLKAKNNPDVFELNYSGSFGEVLFPFSFNFNFARSQRDRRLIGDEYSRAAYQFSNKYVRNEFTLNSKISGNFIFDEEEPRFDFSKTKNYNRGFFLSVSNSGVFNDYGDFANFEYLINLNYTKENSLKSKLVESDLRILPNGDTIGAYIGKVRTLGEIWQGDFSLDYKRRVNINGKNAVDFLAGIDLSYENNFGKGLVIDSIFNYYGPFSPLRSKKFSDMPGQIILSYYAEFQNKIDYVFPIDLNLGFRLESYYSTEQDFYDFVKHKALRGSFLNPRLGIIMKPANLAQVRASYGLASKSPAASYIFPKENVIRWRNPLDSSIKYFKFDRKNKTLKGHQDEHIEIAVDFKVASDAFFTISGYIKNSLRFPEEESFPVFHFQNFNDKWHLYYVGQIGIYKNSGKNFAKGIEVSLRGVNFRDFNLNLFLTYFYSKTPSTGKSFTINNNPAIGQKSNYRPPNSPIDTLLGFEYPKEGFAKDYLKLNYQIRYFSKELGLWITFLIEHMICESSRKFNLIPVDYSLLNPTELRNRLFEEALKKKGQKVLMNLFISKKIFEGAEISFFANNFLDDPAIRKYYATPEIIAQERRNPSLFFGIEFSWAVNLSE